MKRPTNQSEVQPRKQARSQGDQFTFVSQAPSNVSPYVVNFAQGPPPRGALTHRPKKTTSSDAGDVDSSEPLAWKSFRPASQYAKRKLVVAENSAVEYTALLRPSALNSYAVGVVDRSKNTITLLPIDDVCRLQLRLKGSETLSQIEEEEGEDPSSRKRLVETFGSKKRQQAQRRADLHNIRKLEKDDIQSSAAIDSMLLEAAATAQERTNSSSEGQRKTLPPYNLRAKTVEEAYDLQRMLPVSVWEAVPWKLFVNVAKRPSKLAQLRASGRDYPTFVLDHIAALNGMGATEARRCAEKLSVLTFLIRIHKLVESVGKRSLPALDVLHEKTHIPIELLDEIVPMFAVKRGSLWSMPTENRMLLINAILVIMLHVDGFKTPLGSIASDLRMTDDRLKVHFGAIGCKLRNAQVNNKSVSVAVLTVPLEFAQVSKGRRKR
eukprot:CAMPEP_0174240942 /NCGR_PEP_ID=MMETSP0417-20130205/21229_1 /TAXON_ID=242541 /ORGANISM="Mayorella sp, Strain BSH-02190019" /LENGTH=436 /DNA_ID=CAMNT_0015320117 /DNA_START=62 /DNA_END=1372 /DNA_ORIENTATION=-